MLRSVTPCRSELGTGATDANRSTPVASTGALKPISQVALQTMLDATARTLLIPGAVVLLRQPTATFELPRTPRR